MKKPKSEFEALWEKFIVTALAASVLLSSLDDNTPDQQPIDDSNNFNGFGGGDTGGAGASVDYSSSNDSSSSNDYSSSYDSSSSSYDSGSSNSDF